MSGKTITANQGNDMTKNEAKRIYDNLRMVYETMGGDLVGACLRRGISADLVVEFMKESRESDARIHRAMALLKDDPSLAKRIPDDKMARFESLHDDTGSRRLDPREAGDRATGQPEPQ
ncbi:MAG TPA: hypothetical protein VMW87_06005 [Spirochaetia bacterium]|nr:hypothetical protein [Spirochaetia bacterium]